MPAVEKLRTDMANLQMDMANLHMDVNLRDVTQSMGQCVASLSGVLETLNTGSVD